MPPWRRLGQLHLLLFVVFKYANTWHVTTHDPETFPSIRPRHFNVFSVLLCYPSGRWPTDISINFLYALPELALRCPL